MTEKKKEENRQTVDVRLLQEALRKVKDMVFVKNTDLVYVACSDSFAQMLGKQSEEVIGRTDYDLMPERALAEKYRSDDFELLDNRENIYEMVEALPDFGNELQFARTSKELLTDREGNALGILGISRDVSHLRYAQRHFDTELQNLLDHSDEDCLILVSDLEEWRVIEMRMSPECVHEEISASSGLDTVLEFLRSLATSEAEDVIRFYRDFSLEYLQQLYLNGKSQIVMPYLHRVPGGGLRWMQDMIYLRVNPRDGHLCSALVIRNLEEKRRQNLLLRQQAELDGLTGILNRQTFLKKCREYLQGEGKNGSHAFFMMDVDRFKKINDTLGHQTGDAFLGTLAQVMKNCLRPEDLVARLGGDEFVIFLKRMPDTEHVRKKAEQILQKTREIVRQFPEISPSLSIGISQYPQDGTQLDQLYGHADIALYHAKLERNNCLKFYEENMVIPEGKSD